MLPHGDQGATRSLGMLSGLPPLPQASGRPTAASGPQVHMGARAAAKDGLDLTCRAG